jgi:Peptidase family M48
MNKFLKNQIFLVLAIIITASAPLCGMMDTIKERLYKSIEKPMIYNAGVYTIDKIAQLASNTIIRFICITHKKESVLQKIDHRLAQIEKNLKDDEIKSINAMYQEFNVDKDDQQTINSVVRQYKEFQKQYLSQSHKKECDTLESSLPEILFFCKQINIHPSAVELRISNLPNSLVAQTIGLRAHYQFENDKLIVEDNNIIGHPAIILHRNFFELSYEQRIAVMGHELTHLALQHEEMHNILGMEIKYFTGAKKEEIINSKNWKKLGTICERQAEILHKDAEWASIMKNTRNQGYYSDQLFLKHYAQLTEIDELHKLREEINARF